MEVYIPGNTGNATMGLPERPIFSYFNLVITVFFLIPLLVFNTLLIVAIAVEKSIVGTLRLVLVNIVTAGQVVTLGMFIFYTSVIFINGCWCPELRPSDIACRLMYWVIASGGAARLMYMTTFAISVYILVRYGAKKMKIWVATVAVVGVWVFALLPNAAIFSPDVVLFNFHDNVTCAAHGAGYKAYIYAFGYTGVYGLLGFVVSVFSPIATVWYIRHNTISGDVTVVKAMIKFAIFLILGNIINFVGQTTPLLFAAFAPAGKDWYTLEKAFNYVEGVFILLSLIPTPLFILIHFRPVRQRIIRTVCSAWTHLKVIHRRCVIRRAPNKAVITSHIGDSAHIEAGEKWLDAKGL